MKKTFTIDETMEKLLKFVEEVFGVNRTDLIAKSEMNLQQKAVAVKSAVVADIIDIHPMKLIIEFAMNDIIYHAKAVDLLQQEKSAQVHVRHIEEVSTCMEFLMQNPTRYNEFKWRWDNYKIVHGIRNRLINLNGQIDSSMQSWIDSNLINLQNFIDKKFVSDPNACIKQWEKYGNWLQSISLKDIFEATGRKSSYVSVEYDWNSHFVHFSPLTDLYINLQGDTFEDYSEFSIRSAERYINGLCKIFLGAVTNTQRLREFQAVNVFANTYANMKNNPEGTAKLIERRHNTYGAIFKYMMSNNADKATAMKLVIGDEPQDPLTVTSANV
jgi:hypothetical protein